MAEPSVTKCGMKRTGGRGINFV